MHTTMQTIEYRPELNANHDRIYVHTWTGGAFKKVGVSEKIWRSFVNIHSNSYRSLVLELDGSVYDGYELVLDMMYFPIDNQRVANPLGAREGVTAQKLAILRWLDNIADPSPAMSAYKARISWALAMSYNVYECMVNPINAEPRCCYRTAEDMEQTLRNELPPELRDIIATAYGPNATANRAAVIFALRAVLIRYKPHTLKIEHFGNDGLAVVKKHMFSHTRSPYSGIFHHVITHGIGTLNINKP